MRIMTPIRRTFLSLLCYAFFLTAAGQENFLDGYVVLRSKDTIRGQIDFRDWNANPYQITFQEARTAKKTSFKADELTAFFVSGETYRSYTVTIYPYSLDVEMLSNDFKDTPYDSVAFLRLLLPGKLSLYSYADRQEGHYFFVQRPDERPEQLRIRSSVVDNNGLKALDRVNVYIDQLRSLVYDCPGLSGKTSGLPYTESAIRKLLFSYDHCGKDTVESVAHGGESAVRFEPLVGFIHTSFHVTGDVDAAKMSWPADNSISIGIGAHISLPRSRQQFSFLIDALYNRLYSKSSAYMPNGFTTEMGYIDLQLLQNDVLFRYQYPAGKVRPFAEAGIANIFVIKDKSYMGDQETGETTITRSSLFSLFTGSNGVPSYIFGLTGGAGVQIGRFSIEARIRYASGLSEAEDVSAPITSVSVLAGWSF
jgi:hypothetical protein